MQSIYLMNSFLKLSSVWSSPSSPPLNNQQRESKSSEIFVTQKYSMLKKKLQHNTPGTETGAGTKMVPVFIKIKICFYTFSFSFLQ